MGKQSPPIELRTRPNSRDDVAAAEYAHFVPSVQLDLHSFLTELREWIDAVEAGEWATASERLRDACDEAYCLEGWKEFTNRLGTSNMQHHVHNLRRFLVAVETTARSADERSVLPAQNDGKPSRHANADDDTKRM